MRTALVLAVLTFAGLAAAQATHTVREGQTLARIAHRYHVTVFDLASANRIRPGGVLRLGQVLDLPDQGVTFVRPGQTLAQIAHDHDCGVDELARLNHLRNRRVRAGQELRLPGYEAESEDAADHDWGPPPHPGLATVHRHDAVVSIQLLDAEGRVTRAGLEQLGSLMRLSETDAIELPHPRLVRVLAAISDHFGGREITLVSGRREARGYTRESSRHVSGHATDIYLRGVSRRALWDYCRSLTLTGCGYYPRSTFVHIDVREPYAQWVDWSAPGQRPRYGNLHGAWRRGRPHDRVPRSITRPSEIPAVPVLTPEALLVMPVVPSLSHGEEVDEDEDEALVEDSEIEAAESTESLLPSWIGPR